MYPRTQRSSQQTPFHLHFHRLAKLNAERRASRVGEPVKVKFATHKKATLRQTSIQIQPGPGYAGLESALRLHVCAIGVCSVWAVSLLVRCVCTIFPGCGTGIAITPTQSYRAGLLGNILNSTGIKQVISTPGDTRQNLSLMFQSRGVDVYSLYLSCQYPSVN